MKNGKKLCKSDKSKMLFGVCGGIADFFGIDVTIVRIIAAVLGLLKGFGIILYLVLAVIMPSPVFSGEVYDDENIDDLKSANINDEEKTSKKGSKKTKTTSSVEGEPHSDEEFNSYFKSDKKD